MARRSSLFAWLPLVGDALCVAAGWLKLNWAAGGAVAGRGALRSLLGVSVGALWRSLSRQDSTRQ